MVSGKYRIEVSSDVFAFTLNAVGIYFSVFGSLLWISTSYITPTELKSSFKSLCLLNRQKMPILINLKNSSYKNLGSGNARRKICNYLSTNVSQY